MSELSGYVFLPLREGDISLYRGSGNGLIRNTVVVVRRNQPKRLLRSTSSTALGTFRKK